MTRNERSAGVVAFRRRADGQPLYLLLDYGRHWDFPKGHVEKTEDDRAAAIRELQEETGIVDARFFDDFSHQIAYVFRAKDHALIHKKVVFFLCEVANTHIILSHEHVGSAFLAYEPALKKLTYPNAREVLTLAHHRLGQAQ